jgi:hypothetical protein
MGYIVQEPYARPEPKRPTGCFHTDQTTCPFAISNPAKCKLPRTHTCCRANNILHGKSRSLCSAASAFHTLLLCFVEDILSSLMVSEHWRSRNQRECGVRQISSLQARIFLIPEPFIFALVASSGIILDLSINQLWISLE